ncbi:MAG TPA: flagellar hook capping FlgD N-terminal domain-containing protein [Caulobacteraceae bacterium]|nr:flagellar hook capping FlgD N-terminal domain-containing protein [Caulobacteraceae bacterium]
MTTAVTNTTPNTAPIASAVNNGLAAVANNYQTFLSLLTTQLKNQDPLSPLDTNQFTQQLTQMTGVEQQLLSNQLLQQLVNQSQGGAGLTGAVGLIGKTVTADGTTATLSNGSATWLFSPQSAPASLTASVSDSTGNVIWSGPISPNGAGPQTFTWNGKNLAGVQQTNGGSYKLNITASDASGVPIPVATTLQGVASAVQIINGQTMVTVGNTEVPLSAINGVT